MTTLHTSTQTRTSAPTPTIYVDQYGAVYHARTRKELMQMVPGRVYIMYRDKIDGRTVRCGYTIGKLWLTAYAPVEYNA